MKHTHATTIAWNWISTDKAAVLGDIARLGAHAATEYQMDLIADRQVFGDTRWDGVTKTGMKLAVRELMEAAAE